MHVKAHAEFSAGKLRVAVVGVEDLDMVTVRLRPARNGRISKLSDTSPLRPANFGDDGVPLVRQYSVLDEIPSQARDIFFPVVDVDLGSCDVVGVIEAPGAVAWP